MVDNIGHYRNQSEEKLDYFKINSRLVMQDSPHSLLLDLKYLNFLFWAIFSTTKFMWNPQPLSYNFRKTKMSLVRCYNIKSKILILAMYFQK